MTLKPQDILMLLQIALQEEEKWSYATLANDLFMSASETHAGLARAEASRLFDPIRKKVNKRAFAEFLIHGVKYAYPPTRGGQTRGIPTGYAAPPLSSYFTNTVGEPPVWPAPEGTVRGYEFSPLYRSAPDAALKSAKLYEMLALVDAIRGGVARESQLAVSEINARLGQ